jgi:AcrR family transcriptional regulator
MVPVAEPAVGSPARGVAREEAILAAAIELVAEIGYDRMTLDAIAKRAKASKATIYRKWPGKAELVAEALRRHAEQDSACVADTGSVRGDLLVAVDGMVETIVGDGGPSLIGLLEAVREDAVLRELIRGMILQQSRETGAAVVDRARSRQEAVRDVDPADVVELLVAHLFLAILLNGAAPSRAARERVVDTMALPLLLAPTA